MANLGDSILKLRNHLNLSQEMFGALIGTSAMNVSRYERNQHPVPGHTSLALGLLAGKAGMDGWLYWELAGITRTDARAMLGDTKTRAVGA